LYGLASVERKAAKYSLYAFSLARTILLLTHFNLDFRIPPTPFPGLRRHFYVEGSPMAKFKEDWKKAKTAFETATQKKKPSASFLGVFNKGTGISAALESADNAKTAGDLQKAMATFQKTYVDYPRRWRRRLPIRRRRRLPTRALMRKPSRSSSWRWTRYTHLPVTPCSPWSMPAR